MSDPTIVSAKQSVDIKNETRADGSKVKTITTTTVSQHEDGSTSTETSIKIVNGKVAGNQAPVAGRPIPKEIEETYKVTPVQKKPGLPNVSENLMDSPKKTPFIIRIGNNGLPLGTKITISGCVLKSARRFDIDLCEAKDGRVSAFHFNPRFSPPHIGIDANVVVRNSCSSKGWGQEERAGPPFPFVKGKCFKIVIRCVRDYHEVSVNDKPFINFIHRVPLKNINFLRIGHDVEISSIEVTGQTRDSLRI